MLRARKLSAGIRNVIIELDWLKIKVNKMLIERDWLNILVDRGENNVLRYWSWPSKVVQPHAWTSSSVVFIDGDANMNSSHGRKRIYLSAGLRATYLSRGRKRTLFWRLRVAVDSIWLPRTSCNSCSLHCRVYKPRIHYQQIFSPFSFL